MKRYFVLKSMWAMVIWGMGVVGGGLSCHHTGDGGLSPTASATPAATGGGALLATEAQRGTAAVPGGGQGAAAATENTAARATGAEQSSDRLAEETEPGEETPLGAASRSPLGTNLTEVTDWSTEWAFVDAFKVSRAWISGSGNQWDDHQPLDLDERGWIRSLRPGQVARTLLSWDNAKAFPRGRYVVLYEGQGALEYRNGAQRVARESRAGRDVVEFNPAQGSFQINLTAVARGNPLRNIRVLMPGGVCSGDPFRWCDAQRSCGTGACIPFEENAEQQIFHPIFLEKIRDYSVLRFMDWMGTNNSEQRRWADRPQVADARWSTRGVPVEIMVELANRLQADPWFTLPHQADDAYIRQFAQAVKRQLRSNLRVYVEHSNEVWNGMFAQARYARERGRALGLSNNEYQAQLFYHSLRSTQIFSLFSGVFGGSARLVRVMGSQAANAWASEQLLDFRNAKQQTDALGIAPYFGGPLGTPEEQARVSRMRLPELLDELERQSLPLAERHMQDSARVARSRGVRLVAYEGGQHLAGHGGVENNQAINRLFDEANRHPRMEAMYLRYLQQWRQAGGQLMVHFNNCSSWSKWGRWGAMEHLLQSRGQAPKYEALRAFAERNPRWW